MNKLLTITVALVFVSNVYSQLLDISPSCGLGTNSPNKIVGGTESKKGNWGWQVSLRRSAALNPFCGGSLIASQWVVTAAHCVEGYLNPARYQIDIGYDSVYLTNMWSIERGVEKIIMHPDYDTVMVVNDIALMKLDAPVVMDEGEYKVNTVCLPDGTEDFVGKTAWATGFGRPCSACGGSYDLMQVNVPVLTDSRCVEKFSPITINPESQICAGDNEGKDTCNGDSGGPLVVRGSNGRWVLAGLTSFGSNPCGEGGVYTRLSAFTNWIRQIMEEN